MFLISSLLSFLFLIRPVLTVWNIGKYVRKVWGLSIVISCYAEYSWMPLRNICYSPRTRSAYLITAKDKWNDTMQRGQGQMAVKHRRTLWVMNESPVFWKNMEKCENFTADLVNVHEHDVSEPFYFFATGFIVSTRFQPFVHFSWSV